MLKLLLLLLIQTDKLTENNDWLSFRSVCVRLYFCVQFIMNGNTVDKRSVQLINEIPVCCASSLQDEIKKGKEKKR